MKTDPKAKPGLQSIAGPKKRLTVSFYERVSSLLVALLVLVGTAVFGLVFAFFSSHMGKAEIKAMPVTVADIVVPHEGTPGGSGRDLEEPAADEIPELVEPLTSDTLSAVSSAVSSRETLFEDIAMDGRIVGGPGRGRGTGSGVGDGDGGVAEKVPRAQRWEIRFQAADLKIYAATLDFFGIELAVLNSADNTVKYAFNLAKSKPDQRAGSPDTEKRLYMTWRSGPLQAADQQLLAKAGIPVGTNIAMQFYPGKVENDLAVKERQHAGSHSVDEIRKTIYGVKQTGKEFSFFVLDQKYY